MAVCIEKIVVERLMEVDDFILYIAHFVLLIHLFALFSIAVGRFPTPSEIYAYAIAVNVGLSGVGLIC